MGDSFLFFDAGGSVSAVEPEFEVDTTVGTEVVVVSELEDRSAETIINSM